LISTCSKAGCYAVLASLSGRYPPFEGRSPTCYSPVRHSTKSRSPFRVRLACVRHAASVDSEPGSNSHVNLLFHPSLRRLRGSLGTSQLLTRSPVDLALALSVCRCCPMVHRISSETSLRRFTRRCDTHQADTRRVLHHASAILRSLRRDRILVCLHALSSFQRTGKPDPFDVLTRSGTPPIG
jgi:hypothetical protein